MPSKHLLPMVLACLVVSCGEAPKRPNILLLSVDTLRADRLGCYGGTRGLSPAIDALAARSTVFDAAHSSSAWTLPSLCSLMTGLPPSTHGATQLDSMLPPGHRTLAEHLLRAGYDTAIVAPHVFMTESYGLQQGFNLVDEELVVAASDFNTAVTSPGVSDRGVRFLEAKAAAQDGAPWFLWLHYFDPHAEYVAHPGVSERFGTQTETDLYDGEIAFTDQHLARVLAALERTGLDRETIVVFTADHGEEFGEHGGQRHGTHLHQEVVRVPLLVRLPPALGGGPEQPDRVRPVVGTIDLLPTLLDLCRLPPADGIQGRSLVPLLRGLDAGSGEILMEVSWRAKQNMHALRAGDSSYHDYDYPGAVPISLYRVDDDPYEVRDLAQAQPEQVAAWAARLEAARARARAEAARWPAPGRTAAGTDAARQLQSIGYAGADGTTETGPRDAEGKR